MGLDKVGIAEKERAVTQAVRIVDSAMGIDEALAGTKASQEVIRDLCLISVPYVAFDGCFHEGQLVVHRELAEELKAIFALMEILNFPIAGAVPIVRYGWSDEASMAADNASSFNYRFVAGTARLSRHATGRAVDINPRRNPALYPDGRIAPRDAQYLPGSPGVFSEGHPVVCAFKERGWRWGGDFDHMKDYHHFEIQGD